MTVLLIGGAINPNWGIHISEWINRLITKNTLLFRYGTLLAHACQSSLILGDNVELVEFGKSFGLEIALAWQVKKNLFNYIPVWRDLSIDQRFSTQANNEIQSYKNTSKKADHVLFKLFPAETPINEVILNFQAVRDKHVDAALKILGEFPKNDANLALCNIARALKY
jgi:decaprenyl-diphosphate synthase subunit 2